MPAVIVDQELLASVIRQFNLRGNLSPFNLTENVVPTFDIGKLTALADQVQLVETAEGSAGVRVGTSATNVYVASGTVDVDDGDFTDSGAVVNPGAGQIIVDTGQLGGGNHQVFFNARNNAAISDFELQWRDAANAVTIASMIVFAGTGQPTVQFGPIILGVATNERLRVVAGGAVVGTVGANIIAHQQTTSIVS